MPQSKDPNDPTNLTPIQGGKSWRGAKEYEPSRKAVIYNDVLGRLNLITDLPLRTPMVLDGLGRICGRGRLAHVSASDEHRDTDRDKNNGLHHGLFPKPTPRPHTP
jgi:hypothetical protein